ncbi:hypothetical protein OUZ56_012134 [Daphnia magna]|uniref:Uncharacterized protein n=1 Tax=Daphnia magna TaxID=35525 RepID=A0ABQ9Z2F9_9CRUS|nr:hypothetical protein OUZ56_012134 [Daphnia magna]
MVSIVSYPGIMANNNEDTLTKIPVNYSYIVELLPNNGNLIPVIPIEISLEVGNGQEFDLQHVIEENLNPVEIWRASPKS